MSHISDIYELFEHSYRVSRLCFKMAIEIDLSDLKAKEIAISGFVHDFGKLMLDQNVLHKKGKLTKSEFDHIKKHSELGFSLAKKLPFNDDILDAILQHHENYDGSGYPFGYEGDEIHLGAKIVKLCDVYDALISDRPYRKGYSSKEAISFMENQINEYDPFLFKVLKSIVLNEKVNNLSYENAV